MPVARSLAPVGLARYPALDGLRGLAVLLVLYHHAPMLLGRGDGSDGAAWHASPGAWLGVDLFFVLSGFLITSILLHGRGEPGAFRRFWVRRALRIFPLGYFYLAVLAATAWLLPGFVHLRDGASFAWASVYALNVHVADAGWGAPAFGLLWSLAVEEHFYLLWPPCALRARLGVVAGVLLAIVAVTPLVRWWLLPTLGPVAVYVLTFCRWDTLACGALLALAWHGPHRARVLPVARWLALPAAAWLALVVATPIPALGHPGESTHGFQVVGYSLVAVSFTVWCALAIEPGAWLQRALGNAPLRAIGRVSYGLYVWHVLTAELTARGLARLGVHAGLPLRAAAWLVVLFATAWASWRWLEAPMLRLKERLAP